MIVCVPVTADGQVGGGWGRADRVAVADVDNAGVTEHKVTCVVAGHMGPPMEHMLGQMGITVRLGATGDARAAILKP
jgi:predicted Fe-Mo cluster-binding NifX family protein